MPFPSFFWSSLFVNPLFVNRSSDGGQELRGDRV
jgi:hypothetical protein